ncbi:signal recognition particle protein [uncultured Tyzzerella sp.]|uniref:signal recognition particle protein n=1 Tax=uncultured Tyzzerella sp. TaxID=2321398 RepID=UPI002942B4A8|nr:signal recognition particle protein [uncultured Tyzzerella sp.]
MAFENLSSKLQDVFKNLTGKGKLSEKDVKTALREVKLALLEADVNFKIVKEFISNVTEKAIGTDVLEGLNPGQQVIKVVKDELIDLLGTTQSILTYSSKSPTVYMMVGLQGAGKTTTTGKLAGLLRKQGKQPLLVACDIYRPAAIKQLEVVGKTYNIPVFSMGQQNPVDIAKDSINYAKENGNDIVIIDTAGRLHINEELMDELENIKKEVRPQEILLVIDATTGQDAVNVASSFDEKLGIDGTIITKLDGDTRGGAALSVRAVTKKPIKYVGMGEKLEDLEPFHPDRMVSRILGMGDVLTLIEKAQQVYDEKEVLELEKKMRTLDFDLNDFLNQMQQVKKMGSIKDILNMMPLPGMNKINLDDVNINDKTISHIEAIISSMTNEERKKPNIINGSRKKRIANGSGRSIQEVNKLLKDFENSKNAMKMMNGMMKGKKGKFNLPFFK